MTEEGSGKWEGIHACYIELRIPSPFLLYLRSKHSSHKQKLLTCTSSHQQASKERANSSKKKE